MAGRSRAERGAGFALIEALASLVIVGMLGVMLIQGVTTGRRVWERLDTHAAALEAVEGAQSVLRGRFEQLYPATLFGAGQEQIDLQGGPESVTFLAPPAEATRPAPLRRYRLDLTTAGDLVLSSRPDVATPGDLGIGRQVLLTGVRQIDLAYFGAQGPGSAPSWGPSWTAQPLPPELIRVRIAFEPGDPRPWPDLIVHPLTTIDAGCILSAATSHCRGRG